MKRFVQITGIIAVVFIVIGTILFGVGLATGGKEVIADTWNAFTDGDFTIDDSLFHSGEHNYFKEKACEKYDDMSMMTEDNHKVYTADYGSLDSLFFDVCQGKVNFIKGDKTDKITIDIDYSKFGSDVADCFAVEDDEYGNIIIAASDLGVNTKGYIAVINVTVPDGYTISNLNMEVGAGDLNIETSMVVENWDLEIGAGDITFNDMESDSIKIECGAGNIKAKGLYAKGCVDIECGAGNVDIGLDNSNGDAANYSYDLECGIGEITVPNGKYSGLGNDYSVDNDISRTITVECGTGNIDISFDKSIITEDKDVHHDSEDGHDEDSNHEDNHNKENHDDHE